MEAFNCELTTSNNIAVQTGCHSLEVLLKNPKINARNILCRTRVSIRGINNPETSRNN